MAKAQLGLSEDDYRAILETYGGSRSARELDDRGFDAVMNRFRALGFTSTARKRSYGVRFNMATPAQVSMIRALFEEVAGEPTEAALNHWLEKYFKVSSLRFLERNKAAGAITALKAWRARPKGAAHGG